MTSGIRRLVRTKVVLALLAVQVALPTVAQTTATVISPLTAETDHNGVNIATGQALVAIPKLEIPAAPRLNFDLIQNAMPHLVAKVSGSPGGYVESSVAVHTGSAASESFSCIYDDVCTNRKRNGAVIDGSIAIGGPYTFTESQTGAVYTFDKVEYDSGYNTSPRTLQYYASSIAYPDGETIFLTYNTAYGLGRTRHRLTSMSSSTGYSLGFSYQGIDPNTGLWGALAQASLYGPGSSLLGQLTYSGNTITDITGRVFTCTGCQNSVGAPVETSGAELKLPGETANAKVVTVHSSTPLMVGAVAQDGVNWTYNYANLQLATYPAYRYTSVTVTGPNSFNQVYAINQATQTKPNTITSVTDSIGRTTSYIYDNNLRPTRVTAPEGNYVQVTYDNYGNITNKLSQPKTGSGLTAINEYSAINQAACNQNIVLCFRPVSYTDGLGRVTDYGYDSAGRLTSILAPADATGLRRATYLTYAGSSFSAPSEVRVCAFGSTCGTASEFKTQYTYFGVTALPLTETSIDGVQGVSITTTYTYDNAGRRLSEDGPKPGNGDAKYWRYDLLGRKTWEIGMANADGSRLATRYTFRPADDKVTLAESGTIPDHNSSSLTVISFVTTSYDSRRNPVQVAVNAEGATQQVRSGSFDDRGRAICSTVRMNPAAFGSLPADACTLGTQGSQGPDRITRNSYDNADQLLKVQKAFGTSIQQDYVTYTYTNNGKQASVKDANGNLASLTYDGHDRQTQWKFPSKTTPGQVSTTDYEAYGYDAVGNRTSLRKRDGVTLTYQYDALNRNTVKTVPTSASGAAGFSVYYGYDIRGLQTFARFSSTSGQGITNAYDGFGWLTSSTANMGGVSRTISSLYDVSGNRWRISHPDGVYFDQLFNAANRQTSAVWWSPSAGSVLFFGISWDARGLRAGTGRASSNTEYVYNGLAQVIATRQSFAGGTGNVDTTFSYNAASQMATLGTSNDDYQFGGHVATNRNYAVNGLNQYTTAGSASFTYDANGNLTSDGSKSFVYDAENRLVSATSSGGTVLTYDPLGRLWQTQSPTFGKTQFVYDGDHTAVEYDGDTGGIRRRFYWGPGVDEPILQDEGGLMNCSGTKTLNPNHQGSIVAVADCWGNRTNVNSYDEYGIPNGIAQTGSNTNWGRYQYTGQAWLPDLGLYYYKARFYSPTLGRFMQVDPIGYDDQVNLYAYVGNDPVNNVDPDGMCTGSLIGNKDGTCAGTGGFTTGIGGVAQAAYLKQSGAVYNPGAGWSRSTAANAAPTGQQGSPRGRGGTFTPPTNPPAEPRLTGPAKPAPRGGGLVGPGPEGSTVRIQPGSPQTASRGYPHGYSVETRGGQPIDISTGKPPGNMSSSEAAARTHVPLPENSRYNSTGLTSADVARGLIGVFGRFASGVACILFCEAPAN